MRVTTPGEVAQEAAVPDLWGQSGKADRPALDEGPGPFFLFFRCFCGRLGGKVLGDAPPAELPLKGERRQPPSPFGFVREQLGEPFVALQAGLAQLIEDAHDGLGVVPLPRQPGAKLDPRPFAVRQQPERGFASRFEAF